MRRAVLMVREFLEFKKTNYFFGDFVVTQNYAVLCFAVEAKFLLELCDNAHMTGAIQTYDSIMFGSPSLSPKEKAQSPRLFKKSFTAELGNVTPFVIVPGKYSDAELDYLVQHVVGCVVNNNSFNCVAAKLLVLQKSWPQRDRFLQLIRQELAKVAPKYA